MAKSMDPIDLKTSRLSPHLPLGWRRRWLYARLIARLSRRKSAPGGDPGLVRLLGRLKGLPQKVGQYLAAVRPTKWSNFARLQIAGEPIHILTLLGGLGLGGASSTADYLGQFDAFEMHPISAASIGQVHRATWQGRSIVVKFRYPAIETMLASDYRFARRLLAIGRALLPRPLKMGIDRMQSYVDTLYEELCQEADYGRERQNLIAFRAIDWQGRFAFPEPIDALCGEDTLALTFVEGVAAPEFYAGADEAERCWLRREIFDFHRKSLFEHHMLHADPHLGNYIVVGEGDRRRVAVLDFGCVKFYDEDFTGRLARLIEVCTQPHHTDEEKLEAAIAIGFDVGEVEMARPVLPLVLETIFEPFGSEDFDFTAWRLDYKLNSILDSYPHPFTLTLPEEMLLLQRTFFVT